PLPVPGVTPAELPPRPDSQRDGWPVRGHDHVAPPRGCRIYRDIGDKSDNYGCSGSRERRSSASGSADSPVAPGGGHGPNQLSRAPSMVITQPERKSPAGEAR